jgi:hypothetical protein
VNEHNHSNELEIKILTETLLNLIDKHDDFHLFHRAMGNVLIGRFRTSTKTITITNTSSLRGYVRPNHHVISWLSRVISYRKVHDFPNEHDHEGIFAFTLWTNSIAWESCQVAIHNWNSQWSQFSILYQSIEALYMSSWYLFHVEPNLSLFHFHFTWKTVSISLCLWTWSLIWWNLQVLDRLMFPVQSVPP